MDPSDGYMFAQINDGNCVALPFAKDFGWGKYVGLDGATVSMTSFGASAPAAKLFEKFGFTRENVAETMRKVIASV